VAIVELEKWNPNALCKFGKFLSNFAETNASKKDDPQCKNFLTFSKSLLGFHCSSPQWPFYIAVP